MSKRSVIGVMLFRRVIFYFLSFTWGALLSVPGAVIILALAIFKRVHVFHGRLYGVVGKNWGGLELGCFFICGENCQYTQLMAHECGHGIQNTIWGPLFLFIIFLPSCIRYWYRFLKYERKGINPPTAYDDIWFEGQATDWGLDFVTTDKI